jgi:hypothetical protein
MVYGRKMRVVTVRSQCFVKADSMENVAWLFE